MNRQVWEVVPEAGDGEGMRSAGAVAELGLPSRDEPGDLGLDLRHDAIGRANGPLMAPEPTHDTLRERGPQHDQERLEEADDEVHGMRLTASAVRTSRAPTRFCAAYLAAMPARS